MIPATSIDDTYITHVRMAVESWVIETGIVAYDTPTDEWVREVVADRVPPGRPLPSTSDVAMWFIDEHADDDWGVPW